MQSGNFVHTQLTVKQKALRKKDIKKKGMNVVTVSDRCKDSPHCSGDGWVMTGL